MTTSVIDEDVLDILSAPVQWGAFDSSSVLISGGGGMLASYMLETLLQLSLHGYRGPERVICLARSTERARARFARYLDHSALRILQADVSESFAVDGPADFIVHAASQASPRFYGTDPVGTLSANMLGTRNMLEIARHKASRRLLFFSSSEVYGAVPAAQMPIAEDAYGYLDPTLVRSCYSEGKRAGETMCVAWAHQYSVPSVIVRPFHTFGPGLALDDGRVFADFVADIVNRRDITIKGDGSMSRAFCYVADATRAYFTAMLQGASGLAYNVGSDEEITIRNLAQRLEAAFGERGIRAMFLETPRTDSAYVVSTVNRVCPDITRIRQLGWSPTTSIEDSFRRTVRYCEDQLKAASSLR